MAVAERAGVRSWRELPHAALLCGQQPTKISQSLGNQLRVGLDPSLLTKFLNVRHGDEERLIELEQRHDPSESRR